VRKGHPDGPNLAVIVGVAAQRSEIFDGAPRAVEPGELQASTRAAGRALRVGVPLASAIGVGDVVAWQDLGELALAEGQGQALLSIRALARASVWGGSEEGRVGGDVGVTRCLPSGWDMAIPECDGISGNVCGCGFDVFIVIELCEVSATTRPNGPVEDESGVNCALCFVFGWWGV
jgi:hypothetical protein